jgi:hypothetical protein
MGFGVAPRLFFWERLSHDALFPKKEDSNSASMVSGRWKSSVVKDRSRRIVLRVSVPSW